MRKHRLAICAIIKNEARYLKEWIEHHRAIGVEHFYLFDNGSVDHTRPVLAPYVRSQIVTVHDWPASNAPQLAAYRFALQHYSHDSEWIAFIDADEFIVSPAGDDLISFLDRRPADVPGVALHWALYGSNGMKEYSDEPVTKRFTRRGPLNPHVKSIVRPEATIEPEHNPHTFRYRDGLLAVDVNGDRIPSASPLTEPKGEHRFRINHYHTKSEEEYRAKCSTPRADNGLLRAFEPMWASHDVNGEEDACASKVDISMSDIESQRFPANYDAMIRAIEVRFGNDGARHGAEIGVRHGDFSSALLGRFSTLTLSLVDPYLPYVDVHHSYGAPEQDEIKRTAMTRLSVFGPRADWWRVPSLDASRQWSDQLDFVFIDAAHDRASVAADIDAWIPWVRAGGLLAGHDYDMEPVRAAVQDRFGPGQVYHASYPADVWVVRL